MKFPGQGTLSNASINDSNAKFHDRVPLANNIVDLANRIQQTDPSATINFTPTLDYKLLRSTVHSSSTSSISFLI